MATRIFTAPPGKDFSHRKLVQVQRVIVVNGAPRQAAEIARRPIRSGRRPMDSRELGERVGRKIWNQSLCHHRLMGNSLQDRAVLFIVSVYHSGHPIWIALV